MAKTVEVFAPARADLAGGTLDLWPLWCFHPDSVTINASLSCGVRLRVSRTGAAWLVHEYKGTKTFLAPEDRGRELAATVVGHFLPEGGVQVEVLEQLPVGSGLGGSSVFAVALARACLGLTGRRMSRHRLVHTLKDLEAQVLQAPTGIQDYYPALLPGVLAIRLLPGGEEVRRIGVRRRWLAAHLAVVYTGVAHHSGMVNWQVYRARVEGERGVGDALGAIAAASRHCLEALLALDSREVGAAIAREWEARRTLAPEVCPPFLAQVLDAGLRAGAWAAKACGAGGGGSVLFWGPPSLRPAILRAALEACPGGAVLPV